MTPCRRRLAILVTILALLAAPAAGEEGMWLLDTVTHLPLGPLRSLGLQITPQDIYSTDAPSLKDAVVNLSGGTGSFLSDSGLILTNHHVAYSAIQSLSSTEHDYLRNGFLAHGRSEELPTQVTAEVVISMRDITGEVLSAVPDTLSGEERTTALQIRMRALETDAKGNGPYTCRASELYGGLRYHLYTLLTLRDIRLVFAPPSSIGNFGGEVDNWMWPRHTGDFAIMRAYTAPDGSPAAHADSNIPYRPRKFLPVSRTGVREGDFAMILGFPAATFRHRDAASVQLAFDETLPTTIDLYTARIDAVAAVTDRDRAAEIMYASKVRSLANTSKKYRGVLEGMRQRGYPAAKRREDGELGAWIAASAERTARYGNLLPELERSTAVMKTVNRKNLWFTSLNSAVEALAVARRFASFAEARPDPPSEQEKEQLRTTLKSVFKNFDVRVDRDLLRTLIMASAALPAGQTVSSFAFLFEEEADRERRVRRFVEDLYADTRTTTPEGCEELLAMDPDEIRDDPMVRLADLLTTEQEPVTAVVKDYNATMAPLRRRYLEARLEWKNTTLTYPDANRTLRLTFGRVMGYSPRNAVHYSPLTTLRGVMEKENSSGPFSVPPKLRELWEQKDFGPYIDTTLGDVPVAFLATLDITGGNSGSPVLNGRGELIGCAFDGTWESVAGDYYFAEEYNRSINVDARYVLFILEKFAGATHLLQELTIR